MSTETSDFPANEAEVGADPADLEPEIDFTSQQQLVTDFINGLTAAFGVEGHAEIISTDKYGFEVNVAGDLSQLGVMIGPRGRHVSALHEVCKTMLQRKLPMGGRARLRVDVGGYRQKRREALEAYVRELVDGVKNSGVERGLEPMSAADRKVVHDVVNQVDGVSTISVGDEPRRRVVVVPAA